MWGGTFGPPAGTSDLLDESLTFKQGVNYGKGYATHSDMCEISETCEADELWTDDCGQNDGELNENCWYLKEFK